MNTTLPRGIQITHGSEVTYRVDPPGNGTPASFSLTFLNSKEGWRRDGSKVPAFEVLANSSRWSAYGYPGIEERGELRRENGLSIRFALEWIELLHLEIQGAAEPETDFLDPPRQARFTDEAFIAAMPPVEPVLYSFIPTLQIGLRDWKGVAGDWWMAQEVQDEGHEVLVTAVGNTTRAAGSTVWDSFRWNASYDSERPVPTVMTLDLKHSDGRSFTWMAALDAFHLVQAPVIRMETGMPDSLAPVDLSPMTVLTTLTGARLHLPPTGESLPYFYNASEMYEALSRSDPVLVDSIEHEDLFLHNIWWIHRGWYLNDNETGKGWDPAGVAPYRARWLVQYVPIGLQGHTVTHNGGGAALVEYESHLFHELGTWESNPKYVTPGGFHEAPVESMVTPDGALSIYHRAQGTEEIPDWIMWHSWSLGEPVLGESQIIWSIRSGCDRADQGPATLLNIDVRTGWIDSGYVSRAYNEGPCKWNTNDILA